jgi:ribosomal protein L11 methyltransferase
MNDPGWIQIKVTVPTEKLQQTEDVMSMISNYLQIEDYSDIGTQLLDGIYGDLIDEDLLKKDRTSGSVSVYVTHDKSPQETSVMLRKRLGELNIPAKVECIGIKEEDWANSWKKWYKPIKTGKDLVIVPEWEKYDPKPGEKCVIMNPGMAFGAGTHETTRLCASLLEEYVRENESHVLDVGCGSGILAICASRLGAVDAYACDIDPMAVKVARENVGLNHMNNVDVQVSDLLKDVPVRKGGYDVICANIVADVIIRMLPDVRKYISVGGVFIISGIIEKRKDEVEENVLKCGFAIEESRMENGWYAAACRI